MKLLAVELPRLARLVPPTRTLAVLCAAALVVSLELFGRTLQSDAQDVLPACALLTAATVALMQSGRGVWPGRGSVRRGVARLVDHAQRNYGFDLRGEPPYPQRTPSGAWLTLLVLLAWTAAAASVWWLCPNGWRDLGVRSSYVVYLVLLTSLWAALSGVTAAALLGTAFFVERRFRPAGRKTQERRALEMTAAVVYFFGVLTVAWTVPLPAAAVLGLCAALAAAALAYAAAAPAEAQAVLWRAAPGRPIYAVPDRRIAAGAAALALLFVGNLILTATGGRLLGRPDQADPLFVTAFFGQATAWFVPGFVLVAGLTFWRLRAADPALRTPLTLHWATDLPLADLKLCKPLMAQGWRVRRKGDRRRKGDVAVRVVPQAESEAFEFQPKWPLKVSLDDLDHPDVIDRLARRDALQLRRRAYRGLRAILTSAYAEKKRRGGHYHFAPHWWHSPALTYEEPARRLGPPTARPLGPWYAAAFGRRVRQQFHAVLRALQIDEVIVDDGVPARDFQRVVRSLFELYDLFAGGRRAEDHLLAPAPGVAAMIHDCQPDDGGPAERGGFDEGRFTSLNRLRVLHVFKDEGDQFDPADAPLDSSWEPAPTLTTR